MQHNRYFIHDWFTESLTGWSELAVVWVKGVVNRLAPQPDCVSLA